MTKSITWAVLILIGLTLAGCSAVELTKTLITITMPSWMVILITAYALLSAVLAIWRGILQRDLNRLKKFGGTEV